MQHVVSAEYWRMVYVQEWRVRDDDGILTCIGNLQSYWIRTRHIAGILGVAKIATARSGARSGERGARERRRIVGKDGIYDEIVKCF
jgi:hypothetical protein